MKVSWSKLLHRAHPHFIFADLEASMHSMQRDGSG